MSNQKSGLRQSLKGVTVVNGFRYLEAITNAVTEYAVRQESEGRPERGALALKAYLAAYMLEASELKKLLAEFTPNGEEE